MSLIHHRLADNKNPRIRIEHPQIKNSEEETLWKDVVRFAKLVPFEPEPNMGRVQEIKEEIKKGSYLSTEKIEETAARLVLRFSRKE